MKELPNLKQLSEEAKDALIVLLWEELQKLQQAQLEKPKKRRKIPVSLLLEGLRHRPKQRKEKVGKKEPEVLVGKVVDSTK
jgi:transposase